ncbi:MAG: hypothetical protein HQL95_15480 [Magnetococcales bacterium]|nr:hypothetical protein [Magnetococcales bacterium]
MTGRLTEASRQIKTLTEQLEEANQKLAKSEGERERLKQRATALGKKMETLEQELSAARESVIDWPMAGGVGAGVLGILTGVGVWWRRRGGGPVRLEKSPSVPQEPTLAPEESWQTAPPTEPVQSASSMKTPSWADAAMASALPLAVAASQDEQESELEMAGPMAMESSPPPTFDPSAGLPELDEDSREVELLDATQDAPMFHSGTPFAIAANLPELDDDGQEGVELVLESDMDEPPVGDLQFEVAEANGLETITFSLDMDSESPVAGRRSGPEPEDDGALEIIEFDGNLAAKLTENAQPDQKMWPTMAMDQADMLALEFPGDQSGDVHK